MEFAIHQRSGRRRYIKFSLDNLLPGLTVATAETPTVCWLAARKSEAEKGATFLHYYPCPLPVEESEGRRIQPCMVPIILGNSFVKMQFHLQAKIKDHYATLYATPVLIKVVNQ